MNEFYMLLIVHLMLKTKLFYLQDHSKLKPHCIIDDVIEKRLWLEAMSISTLVSTSHFLPPPPILTVGRAQKKLAIFLGI